MSPLIRIRRVGDVVSSEITDEALYLSRRDFLQVAASTAGTLASARLLPACTSAGDSSTTRTDPALEKIEGVTTSRLSTNEELTSYKDATTYNNFYEFGTGKSNLAQYAQRLVTKPWSVTIEGQVTKPGAIPLEDILKPHTPEERIYRLRCVEAWSMVIAWIGIPLGDVLRRFAPSSGAKYVAFRTLHDAQQMPGQQRGDLAWPYREGLRIDEAMHPLTILAVGMYGRVLPNQNGAPLRLVVPWKYGFKSIKSIVGIRLTETQPRTFWNQSLPYEYGFYANVNPRVDHPRWSQKTEQRIGEFGRRRTLPFNGYAEEVGHLYAGMDLRKYY